VLNFIYYPVSFILWVWHRAFGYLLGYSSGITWALSVVFLVFTLRAILYWPFVHQMRSMRKMQQFQPEMTKLREKYKNDRQKQTEELQKLQREHGVNPLGGCLPMFVQIPVFIGLFHVLREFKPGKTENYFFSGAENQSFVDASFFGAKLGAWPTMPAAELGALGTTLAQQIIPMIPLMIAAGIFTHITARHSVARQNATPGALDNPQTAMMQKLMLYVFPIGVVVGAPFLPLAILIYWVSNNLWTLGQQYLVYKKIDAEEAAKKDATAATQAALAPRPGQKPVRPDKGSSTAPRPGQKPVRPQDTPPDATGGSAGPPKRPGAKPVTRKVVPPGGPAAGNGTKPGGASGTNGAGAARPPARRSRKRG